MASKWVRRLRRLRLSARTTQLVNTGAFAAAVALLLAVLAWPNEAVHPTSVDAGEGAVAQVLSNDVVATTAPALATVPGRAEGRAIRLDLPPIGVTVVPTVAATVAQQAVVNVAKQSPTAIAFTAAAAVASPVPSSTVKTELIVDGGFERGAAAWYLQAPAERLDTAALRGSHELRVGRGGYAGQRVTVAPGATYRVTVWVRAGAGAGGQAGIRFEDQRYNAVAILDPRPLAGTTAEWTRIAFVFTVPEGATRAVLSFSNPGGNPIEIDSVSVRKVADN